MEYIQLDTREQTALVYLNHPTVNALNRQMVQELDQTLNMLALDHNIRSVIITGAGSQAFCAGADLKERKTMNENEVKHFVQSIRTLFTKIENFAKPVLAAMNGTALGGGLELALACDIRIGAQNSLLGLPETRLAIIPGAGGTQRLPRIIGVAKAKELILTGKRIKAEEAWKLGMVNHVCPASEVLDMAWQLCKEINECGPLAITQAKFAIQHGMQTDIQTGLALETQAYENIIPTTDRKEALNAFIEKRKPVFQGK